MSILLIDDEEEVRHGLGEMLRRAGYEVETAGDGKEGLKRIGEQTIELVITDLLMPGQDGIETIVALRHLHPSIKIIAISGGGHLQAASYLTMAKHLGADCVLAKPFTYRELLKAVGKLLPQAEPPG